MYKRDGNYFLMSVEFLCLDVQNKSARIHNDTNSFFVSTILQETDSWNNQNEHEQYSYYHQKVSNICLQA